MIIDGINFNYLLIEYYKSYKINEVELSTILIIEHLLKQGNKLVTADLLSFKMSLDVNEIDNVLASLFTRGFIEYITLENETCTSLEPLKNKLLTSFQLELNKNSQKENSKKVEEELTNIYQEFEKELTRSLSPIEISKIREWISMGYTEKTIINALKEAISKNRKSLRAVDKILLNWLTRDDLENEGHTTINNEWDHNIQETIAIAKTPWIKNKDDK